MTVSEAPIPWERGQNVGVQVVDHLTVQLHDHVSIGLRTDEAGDYVVSFVVAFDGTARPLPEVEEWIRRASEFLEELP